MPSPSRCLTAGDAFTIVRDRAVHEPTACPAVGLELEWLSHHVDDAARRVTPAEIQLALAAAGAPLPCGGRVTIEPGGQVELSSRPFASVAELVDAVRTDLAVLRAALADAGIALCSTGLDRARPPERVVDQARYRAMEAYFDAAGVDGRTMMCNSASVQINVDVSGDRRDAWRAANIAARVLAETFNEPSPNRLDVWSRIDPSRTRLVPGRDPATAWATYALAARVMFVRTGDDECVPVLEPMTFAAWATRGHPLGWPDECDLLEHLTTLFPPVRPRGWFEIRTLDALDDDRWPRAVELAAALTCDGPERRALLRHGEAPAWA